MVRVEVGKGGLAGRIFLFESSGHAALDEAVLDRRNVGSFRRTRAPDIASAWRSRFNRRG